MLRSTLGFLLFLGLVMPCPGGDTIDFNRDIRPILSGKCFACHGPDEEERAADLRLDTSEGAARDLGGYAAIVAGAPGESEIIYRVTSDDPDELMPPEGKGEPLTPEEVATLEKWIKQGAPYATHWSYVKPEAPEIPETPHREWEVINPIDSFIYRRLASEGLVPSGRADRLTLARRVSLDLTGLPPTWEEAAAFVEDPSPDAYEKYVDRLLARTTYGERWAQFWLDMARYADSAGYADDRPRTIWAYRDWVIRALNDNLPFDQFTIEQLAGDLLENPTESQLVATAFHRNTLTNNEGGTSDEEFRNAAVVDRVNTTMEVWMGTTMACAQCHTHKYDPLTHDEYFQLFDYFNQSSDADRRDESPLLEIWSRKQKKDRESWEARITELRREMNRETPSMKAAREQWLSTLTDEPSWEALKLDKANGATLESDSEGWIALQGDPPATATYSLHFPVKPGPIAGLRLEVSPQQKSNFVLTGASATWVPTGDRKSLDARYLRIELPGDKKMIHLAEVEIFSEGQNIAPRGTATQNSTDFGGEASRVIDGNTDGEYIGKSVSHTGVGKNPWLEIDLGKSHPIESFRIWNRTDGLESRLAGYRIKILDSARNLIWERAPEAVPKPDAKFTMNGNIDLDFTVAVADYEQSGFPAAGILSAKPGSTQGWSIGGATGKAHRLTLTPRSPIEVGRGTLRVRLEQKSKFRAHVLTDFRLAVTDDSSITRWAGIPVDVLALLRNANRSPEEEKRIAAFHRTIAGELAPQRRELASLEKKIANLRPFTTVPIMRDLPADQRRTTRLQVRGNYQNTTHALTRGVPAAFHPKDPDEPGNRLGLARWIVSPENPLTARVIVNRFWERIFGIGIVPTSEEFGSQGEPPSHPDLLDWLAVEFRTDWNIKSLLKTMVMSATYRQETATNPELLAEDPFNRLYARGPRFRIPAEMIRDQALFVSGLLSDRQFGPPVNPPQPNLGLRAAFGGSTDWKTSTGADRYRRGIYTTWRRSSPYPSMATFDAPNREVCTSRRGRTNTPLQALVTLNDPVYVEAAQALARRVLSSGAQTPDELVRFAWRTALIREPAAEEISRVSRLVQDAAASYAERPEEAKLIATDPIGPEPEGSDLAQLAAWTVACNVILNLDEIFLKR